MALYTVVSKGCVEDVSDGRGQTQCAHHGPITVTVVESGYGRGLQAFLNGAPLPYATRSSLCEFQRPFALAPAARWWVTNSAMCLNWTASRSALSLSPIVR
ncbi:hypothetical protein QNM99_16220 [Pseudomonas sp. PCH446]